MEIIQRGKPVGEAWWRGACTCCVPATVARAMKSELIMGDTDPKNEEPWGEANCPVGGKKMFFYEEGKNV